MYLIMQADMQLINLHQVCDAIMSVSTKISKERFQHCDESPSE